MREITLIIIMFLLIYSPKVAGTLDTLSIASFLVFIASLVTGNVGRMNETVKKGYLKWIFFLVLMLIYCIFLYAVKDIRDMYQILRFGRSIVNLLGIYGLVSFYYRFYGTRFVQKILYHLWICIMLHAFLILLMFLFPSLNSFVIDQLIQIDESNRSYETRIEAIRIGGLTSSFDATSGVQSLGLLLIPYIYTYMAKTGKIIVIFSIPLSLFAIAMSGVTGFVMLSTVGLFILFTSIKKGKAKIFRYIPVALFSIGIVFVVFNTYILSDSEVYRDNSLGRTLYMITQDESYYSEYKYSATAFSTIDRISGSMYFLPDNEIDLFFGRGGSGRSNDYKIKADPGLILNIHNLGLIFTILLYGYVLYILLASYRLMKREYYLGLCLISIFSVLLVIDLKVQYLLSRQSFSIMMIGITCLMFYTQEQKTLKQ